MLVYACGGSGHKPNQDREANSNLFKSLLKLWLPFLHEILNVWHIPNDSVCTQKLDDGKRSCINSLGVVDIGCWFLSMKLTALIISYTTVTNSHFFIKQSKACTISTSTLCFQSSYPKPLAVSLVQGCYAQPGFHTTGSNTINMVTTTYNRLDRSLFTDSSYL